MPAVNPLLRCSPGFPGPAVVLLTDTSAKPKRATERHKSVLGDTALTSTIYKSASQPNVDSFPMSSARMLTYHGMPLNVPTSHYFFSLCVRHIFQQ